jgi:hypothetical protein
VAVFLAIATMSIGNRAFAEGFELPPAPEERPARRAVEIDLGFAAPLVAGSMCPDGHRCLAGGGAQFSVLVERRGARGFALGLGYELSLLDGQTVYELSVLQRVFVSFRQYFMPRRAIHPFLAAAGGIGILGDTFRVDTGGILANAEVGLEIELSETIAFTGAFGFQLGFFIPFTTDVDNARRSRGGAPTVYHVAHVGLVIITSPR